MQIKITSKGQYYQLIRVLLGLFYYYDYTLEEWTCLQFIFVKMLLWLNEVRRALLKVCNK